MLLSKLIPEGHKHNAASGSPYRRWKIYRLKNEISPTYYQSLLLQYQCCFSLLRCYEESLLHDERHIKQVAWRFVHLIMWFYALVSSCGHIPMSFHWYSFIWTNRIFQFVCSGAQQHTCCLCTVAQTFVSCKYISIGMKRLTEAKQNIMMQQIYKILNIQIS
jgi:hypothetical protein